MVKKNWALSYLEAVPPLNYIADLEYHSCRYYLIYFEITGRNYGQLLLVKIVGEYLISDKMIKGKKHEDIFISDARRIIDEYFCVFTYA